MDSNKRKLICKQFGAESVDPRIPASMGIPEIFYNAYAENTEGDFSNRFSTTFNQVIPFLERVSAQHKELCRAGKLNSDIPLNFLKIADLMNISTKILKCPFHIDSQGVVQININSLQSKNSQLK